MNVQRCVNWLKSLLYTFHCGYEVSYVFHMSFLFSFKVHLVEQG